MERSDQYLLCGAVVALCSMCFYVCHMFPSVESDGDTPADHGLALATQTRVQQTVKTADGRYEAWVTEHSGLAMEPSGLADTWQTLHLSDHRERRVVQVNDRACWQFGRLYWIDATTLLVPCQAQEPDCDPLPETVLGVHLVVEKH